MTKKIRDELRCDLCGKTKVTEYTSCGVEMRTAYIVSAGDVLSGPTIFNDEDFYEVRPTHHLCGPCIKAISTAANAVLNAIRVITKQG